MSHRATACGQEINALEDMTIDAISLEVCGLTSFWLSMLRLTRPTRCSIPCPQEVCGHCLQLFQENQARISHLESYLQQYGYQPQAGFSIPLNPLELVKSAGIYGAEGVLWCYVVLWQRLCATVVICYYRLHGDFYSRTS